MGSRWANCLQRSPLRSVRRRHHSGNLLAAAAERSPPMRSGAEAALHPASTPEAGAFFHNALNPTLGLGGSRTVAPAVKGSNPFTHPRPPSDYPKAGWLVTFGLSTQSPKVPIYHGVSQSPSRMCDWGIGDRLRSGAA